jgi:hypothetical protein
MKQFLLVSIALCLVFASSAFAYPNVIVGAPVLGDDGRYYVMTNPYSGYRTSYRDYDDAFDDGYDEGYDDGYDDGYDERRDRDRNRYDRDNDDRYDMCRPRCQYKWFSDDFRSPRYIYSQPYTYSYPRYYVVDSYDSGRYFGGTYGTNWWY